MPLTVGRILKPDLYCRQRIYRALFAHFESLEQAKSSNKFIDKINRISIIVYFGQASSSGAGIN